MTKPEVVVLFKPDQESLDYLLENGHNVALVMDSVDRSLHPDLSVFDSSWRVFNVRTFDSIDEISAIAVDLLESAQVIHVLSPIEDSQYGAGLLSHLLGLASPSPATALMTRDKRAMKRAAESAGWSCPRFVSGGTHWTHRDSLEVASVVGLPAIVKPVNGLASLGVRVVSTVDELQAVQDAWRLDSPLEWELNSREMVVEEFIRGTELHVDAVWRGDECWGMWIGQYLQPRGTITHSGRNNGSMYLPRTQFAELYEVVLAKHARLNRELGLTHGATHLELFQTDAGKLVFSEIASRPGGAFVSETIEVLTGTSLKRLWLAEQFGQPKPVETLEVKAPYRFVGLLNISPEVGGALQDAPDTSTLHDNPHILRCNVRVRQGDVITVDHPSQFHVLVALGANSHAEFLELCEEVQELPVFVKR